MSHTPGPWVVSEVRTKGLHGHREVWSAAGIRFWIAEVQAHEVESESGEANARLIAAAPEGLKLAQMVVKYFGDEPISKMLDGDIALRDAARAFIAKAEGR